jgi:UDPglucose 6-dehydrogenase
VVASNDNRKRSMGRKVVHVLGGEGHGKVVALLGLTFKANTDDMRDSPALAIIRALQDWGAVVRAYDPEGMEQAARLLENVTYCSDAYEAMDGADAAVIVTEWPELRDLPWLELRDSMRTAVVIDGRNHLDGDAMRAAGFAYEGMGRAVSPFGALPETSEPQPRLAPQ